MSDGTLTERTAIEPVARRGRYGKRSGEAGVALEERTGLAIVSVTAHKGKAAALSGAVKAALGIDPPVTPRRVEKNGVAFLWAGPERWLAVTRRGDDFEKTLTGALAGLAAIVDQSDGRSIIAIGGGRARDVLAKGLPIDLHPRAFQPGHTALTRGAHFDLQIWQIDNRPSYEIAISRSFARSFWLWLTKSAAEYGYDVTSRN